MAACSQFAAAFGFQLLISPVSGCAIDLGAVSGGLGAGGFLDPSAQLSDGLVIEEGASPGEILAGDPGVNIVYDGDTVTTQSVFRLRGLTNAGLETDTGSENIITYDEEGRGFDQAVAISKSWTLSVEGVTRFNSSGYKVLRLLEANAVSGQLKCKVARIGPNGTTEAVYGYATVTNFSESVESGAIVTFSCELQGYGALALDLDNTGTINLVGPIQTLAVLNGGTGLLDGSYTDTPLTGGTGNGLATADLTVSGGQVIDAVLVDAGDGYAELEVLGADLAGATVTGLVDSLSIATAGINLADGTYTGLATTGGSGDGLATVDATVAGNVVTVVGVADPGSSYQVGDVLTIAGIPGAANPDLGAVLGLASLVPGSNYDDGTFTNVPATGGTGTGLLLDITVTGGQVTSTAIADGGTGYSATEVVTAALDPAVIPGTGEALTITVTDPGANLEDGTYTAEAIAGGTGAGLLLDLTVSGGVITAATINDGGSGYVAGDSALTADLLGATVPGTGEILALDSGSLVGGSLYADGTYTGVPLTGGTGTLATADITVSGGAVTSVVLVNGGSGYVGGEQLSADDADLGGAGGAGFAILIQSVDVDSEGAHTDPTFSVDTVVGDTLATTTPWSVTISAVDENTLLVDTAPTVQVDALTTTEGVHTDPTFRITSLVGNE